jgi:hypothetical protein
MGQWDELFDVSIWFGIDSSSHPESLNSQLPVIVIPVCYWLAWAAKINDSGLVSSLITYGKANLSFSLLWIPSQTHNFLFLTIIGKASLLFCLKLGHERFEK